MKRGKPKVSKPTSKATVPPPSIKSQFTDLLRECNDPNARAILKGMEIIAMELRDLNFAGSALMRVPESLDAISSALENESA